jgi:hypothetical protein
MKARTGSRVVSRRIAASWFAPALAPVFLLALAALAVVAAPARALDPGGAANLVPVPTAGIEVELWSDPPAGSLVRPGNRARLYARASVDCYLSVFSVNTEGRMRLLYPISSEDGWIGAGQTCRVPEPESGWDLVFAGPPGMEYVYAVASLYPLRARYPVWMGQGLEPAPLPDDWNDEIDPYRTGWVVGDPFYQVRTFCEELVPYPEQRDTYATAWVYFNLGRRVPYPRYVCADCHWGGGVDPYGPACIAVQIRVGDVPCAGYIDFRRTWFPRYTYEVWTGWRPRHWSGDRWDGPDGRWVWSSSDGHRELRDRFSDARSRGRNVPGHRDRDDRPGPVPWGRLPGEPGRGDVRDGRDGRQVNPRGDGREVRPPRTAEPNPWGRGFEERLRRSVGEKEEQRGREVRPPQADRPTREDRPARESRPSGDDRRSREQAPAQPRHPEVRNADPRPGVTPSKPPSKPDREVRSRESRPSKESAPRSADRPGNDERGRRR